LTRGHAVEAAQREIGQVVEGFHAARAVHVVAEREQVDMPIARAIYNVLYTGMPVVQVVRGLMERPVKPEFD
jgi:glycerol-3-phosphate dehydrogenase (NAD(P)+)